MRLECGASAQEGRRRNDTGEENLRMSNRSLRAMLIAVLVGVAAALTVGGAAASSTKTPKPDVKPRFSELGHARYGKAAFPTFSFSYTDPTDGITYPITMVGNDPRSGHPSTMKTLIIPLKMRFIAGSQDTSELNDLGYVGDREPALNHTFDRTRRDGDVLDL